MRSVECAAAGEAEPNRETAAHGQAVEADAGNATSSGKGTS